MFHKVLLIELESRAGSKEGMFERNVLGDYKGLLVYFS